MWSRRKCKIDYYEIQTTRIKYYFKYIFAVKIWALFFKNKFILNFNIYKYLAQMLTDSSKI